MKLTALFAVLLAAATAFTQEPKFCKVEPTANDSILTADRNVELHLRPEIIEAVLTLIGVSFGTAVLVQTFHDAQSAWDAYREHLIEHGLLPSPK